MLPGGGEKGSPGLPGTGEGPCQRRALLSYQWSGLKNENVVQRKEKSWSWAEEEWPDVLCVTKVGKDRAELREMSLRRSKHTQTKEQTGLVFPPGTNLQEANSCFFFFLWAWFLFCFCASERTRKKQRLRWNLSVSRKDKTQINHLGITPLSSSQPLSKCPSCL